jgi:iron complex outermembrane receptor protein
MKKQPLLLLLLILLTLSLSSWAQTAKVKISGRVGDHEQKPLMSASVALLRSADSSVYKMSVSGKDGIYQFENIPEGKYLVMVSAAGHAKASSGIFTAGSTSVELPVINLKMASKELGQVTVVAQRPMVEQKIDRTVVNVEASVTNVGANALEVLEKAPGVQVDKDGNISLKGKQGVMVMLDGRPSYLTGAELANMLRGMQASQLDQIEIMTNPPARFDASGNSGVINIKTKKNKIQGFNGNLSAGYGQGVYAKTNESLSMNYRNGKFNLTGVYSFARNNNFQELTIFRRYKNDDQSTNAIFEQTSLMRRRNLNNNLKIGIDYFLTRKTTIGLVVSGFYNVNSNMMNNNSFLQDPQSQLDSIVNANSYIKDTWKNGSVNLNLRHQYDSTGREISFDLDYIKYKASNDQSFVNTTYNPDWVKKYDEKLMGDLPTDINIYSAKMDYTLPIKKGTKLEFGLKSSYVITDSRANYYIMEGNSWQTDYNKTNFFEYKENINAVYMSLNKQLTKKLGVQAGLRFENTNYKGFQYGNPQKKDSAFDRSYSNVFPTVYFSYSADKKNQLGLSFGRRIDRPAYQNLNPFLFFIDKYTYNAGNPFLRPQYSNNVELTHIFKGKLTTTLNYSVTNNMFTETFDQEGYATIVRQGNIGKRENMGVAVSLQLPVAKWLTTMIYTNYNYNRFRGQLYGDNIDISAGNLMINMNNQLKFNKGWSAELSGWYRTKGVEGQIQIEDMGQVSAGIAKQIFKTKGSIKFNIRDIFWTQVPRGQINFEKTEARFRNLRDTRVANITFTYRFGKPLKVADGQRKKGGANEEQNRVISGN